MVTFSILKLTTVSHDMCGIFNSYVIFKFTTDLASETILSQLLFDEFRGPSSPEIAKLS